MISARIAYSFLLLLGLSSAAHAACDPSVDRDCDERSRLEQLDTARPSTSTDRLERYEAPSSTSGGWGRDSGGGGGGLTGSGSAGGSEGPGAGGIGGAALGRSG